MGWEKRAQVIGFDGNTNGLGQMGEKEGFRAVMKLGPNANGRDFVIGDLHGSFDLLEEGLGRVKFNKKTDRCFSVGDIIDRGPHSAKCVEYLSEDWFFAVRGNHEEVLISLHESEDVDMEALFWHSQNNGLGWWFGTSVTRREEILEAMRKLPYAIEAQTDRGLAGIIHADVPQGKSWQEFLIDLDNGDEYARHCALWGRERIELNLQHNVDGVGRIYVGHTHQIKGIGKYGNIFAMDTGAVFGLLGSAAGHLSMANMISCEREAVGKPNPRKLVDIKENTIKGEPF